MSLDLKDAAQIYYDKKNNLWVSTIASGVFQTHVKREQFNHLIANNNQILNVKQIVEGKRGAFG